MTVTDWFQKYPIDEFLDINRESGENVPEKVPVDEVVDGMDIRCGPILKLAGTFEQGQTNYRANLMLVLKDLTEVPRVTYKLGPSKDTGDDIAITEGEFKGKIYHAQDGYSFIRYDIDFELLGYEQKVKYAVGSIKKSAFQFFVPSKEQSMNIVSYSCNGFSLGTDTSDYKSSLWFDVLNKHKDLHYHVMLGGGDQIYSDAVKLHSETLKKWLQESNPIKKKRIRATDELTKELEGFYLNNYLAWFGKGFWQGSQGRTLQSLFPLAMAQIPGVNIFDDHDIIDGFGSYHDITMSQEVFVEVGRIAYKHYMLFQHLISPEEELHTSDPSWILGKSTGPFIKEKNHSNYIRLGKEIGFVGLDCRTERKLKQIIPTESYNVIFDRLEKELQNAPEVKHLLVLLGVPIFYPRLVWLEYILNSPILKPVKAMASKGIINKGLVNEFDGGVEVLDDLNDHWCSKHHKRERNYLVARLMEFGSARGVRITILSGDVHLCAVGRVKSKMHHHPHAHVISASPEEIRQKNKDVLEYPENDPRLIFNVISSAICNAPPPNPMASLLAKRSKTHHFNKFCDEDMVPLFTNDPNGEKRPNKMFLNKRNWCDLIIASQSLYKDDVDKDIRKLPQYVSNSTFGSDDQGKTSDSNIEYPLSSDSLVTTIHVEDDPLDFECNSASYELLIPKLSEKFQLEKAHIKHLN